MNEISGKLTVFFEGVFWVGIFEEATSGELRAAKITFGKEPKEIEILSFIQKSYSCLSFSPSVSMTGKCVSCNLKRRQREVRKQMEQRMRETKSQQTIKLQQEQKKLEKTKQHQEKRELDRMNRFAEKKRKRKAKHRGR